MAGRDKTNAWNSIKFIKEHLPIWQEKGMSRGFLESVIEPKYKACSLDVESALCCDVMMFETAYNQPDFITKLKEICKKYRMPYGKVKPELEENAIAKVNEIFLDFDMTKPKRVDVGKRKGKLYNNLPVIFGVRNILELAKSIKEKRKTVPANEGYKTLKVDPEMIEIILNLIRQDITPSRWVEILDLDWESILKYCRMYCWAGFLKKSVKKEKYLIDYSVVKFADGYDPTEKYVSDIGW